MSCWWFLVYLAFYCTNPCAAQWVEDSTFKGIRFTALAVLDSSIVAGTLYGSGTFLSSDAGANWVKVGSGMESYNAMCLAFSGTNLLAGTYNGVYLSTDTARNFTHVLGGYMSSYNALATIGARVYAARSDDRGSGVNFSTDNGQTWNAPIGYLPGNIPLLTATDAEVFAWIEMLYPHCQTWRSTDGTETWFSPELTDTNISVLATYGSDVFAFTDNIGVFRYNGGGLWSRTGAGLTNKVTAFTSRGRNLFAGTDAAGVFLSTDNGATWSPVGGGLLNNYVFAIAVCGPHIFAGTYSGLWRRPLSAIVGVDDFHADLFTHFSLDQNYPNPFNPTTTLKYELPRTSHVTLSVYDVLGREVSVLVNDRMAAGVHEVKFDGTNLASGVYLYRLTAGSFVQTKKLLLLR